MQYKAGTVAVTNGNTGIVGTGTLWLGNVSIGSVFSVSASGVPYIVANVVDNTHITLAAPYGGTTLSGLAYAITTSYTPNQKLAYPEQGDIDTATIMKRSMLTIDTLLGNAFGAVAQAGRVVFTDANGNLTTSANLTSDGTKLVVNGTNSSTIDNNAAAATLLVGGNVNGGLIYMKNAAGSSVGGIANRKAWIGSGADGMAVTALTGFGIEFFVNNGGTASVNITSAGNVNITGTETVGIGGTGSTSAPSIIDGGSGTGGGPYLQFRRNSVAKAHVGTQSVLIGGTSDNLALAASNDVTFFPGGSGTAYATVGGSTNYPFAATYPGTGKSFFAYSDSGGAGFAGSSPYSGSGLSYFTASNYQLYVNSTLQLVATTTGLGINGVTPSGAALHVEGGAVKIRVDSAAFNPSIWIDTNAAGATWNVGPGAGSGGRGNFNFDEGGTIRFVIAKGGAITAGNNITLGDTSVSGNNYAMEVKAGSTGLSRFVATDAGGQDGFLDYDHSADLWLIKTAGSEKARHGAYFKADNAGAYTTLTVSAHGLRTTDNSGNEILSLVHAGATAANQYGLFMVLVGDPNNTTQYFAKFVGNATARCYIMSNGNLQNTNNSYGAISDARFKDNVQDAGSQWDDILALRVRKFGVVDADGNISHRQIGLVAQEVEQTSPGLVTFTLEGGMQKRGVQYSVVSMKMLGALQEAMRRLEAVEAWASKQGYRRAA